MAWGNRSGSIAFDRMAERYDETRGGLDRGEANAAALRPWLNPAGAVLEVGVGTGLVAAALRSSDGAAAGLSVYGVDLSLPMLRKAKERLGGRLVAGDAARLPLRDGCVSSVYLVHVLHLVGDVGAVLAEARRVLSDGGRLLAVTVANDRPLTDADEIVVALFRAVAGERRDRPDAVIEIAQRLGFVLEHQETWSRPVHFAPTDLAQKIEERLWAWTWDLDDATWQHEVVPALDRLRSLPEADRSRETAEQRALLVFGHG